MEVPSPDNFAVFKIPVPDCNILLAVAELLRGLHDAQTGDPEALFRRWFEERLEADFRRRGRRGPVAVQSCTEFEKLLAVTDRLLGHSPHETRAHTIAATLGDKATLTPEAVTYLAQLVMHGLRELECSIAPQRDRGDFSDTINDAVVGRILAKFSTALPEPAKAQLDRSSGPQLGFLISEFLSECSNGWQAKTRQDYEQTFKLARELWGDDRQIANIDRAAVRELKSILLKLPANASKRYSGLSFREMANRAAADGHATMLPKTINKKLSNLSSFFKWLQKSGYVPENPVSGLLVPDTVAAKDKRDPFDSKQLSKIFTSGVFTCRPMLGSTDAKLRALEDFWIPLIALFTGMRLGEVAQLDTADLRQLQGVLVFDVHGRAAKHLKTRAAERKIPIHQALLELGLLKYRDHIETLGHARLFPAMRPASDGFESSAFSKRFSRFLRQIGVKQDRRLCFHSLRHVFKDLLRDAGVDGATQDVLVGHETGGVAANYGRGFSAEALHTQLHRIEVPIDLRHLNPL